MKFLLLLVFGITFHSIRSKSVKRTTLGNLENVDNCADWIKKYPNYKKELNYYDNVTITKHKLSQVANGHMFVNYATNVVPTVATLKRCQSKQDSDCENFISMKFKDICPMFTEAGQSYSPAMKAFSPQIKCPFVKGQHFLVQNATIDGNDMLKMLKLVPNVYSYYWIVRLESVLKGISFWCTEVTFRLHEVKTRQ